VLSHEHIRTGPWLIGIGVGIGLLLAGIVTLDTSPLIHCLQRTQRRETGRASQPSGQTPS
jgi:hypothetical protein